MPTSNSEDKKKSILIAAADIVKEEGVAKLTLEAVAKKLDSAKGACFIITQIKKH